MPPSLLLFGEVDAGQDDDHQEDQSQHAEQYELVLPDPVHHGSDYLATLP